MISKLPPVILESVPCPLGCSSGDEQILVGRDRLHNLPGEFPVVRCRACGLMRTTPRPTPSSIGFYYPDDYGPYLGTQVSAPPEKPVSMFRRMAGHLYKLPFEFNTEILPRLPTGRLLEVGCASGAFLHKMRAAGWTVTGIELSPSAAIAARQQGCCVHTGALESVSNPEESYNLIVGWMVLEHLHDPIGGLVKLRDWAERDAWLVLSLPNAGSMEFRLFRDKWYALQVPTHLYHFTVESLGRVLSASGWEIEAVFHHRLLSNLIASTGYSLRDLGAVRIGQKFIDFPERLGRWPYILYPLAFLLSAYGQTGRMTVWARRAS